MLKKAGTVILILTVLILTAGLLTACGPKKYKITITSGKDLIDECPKRAAEGETVKIITCGVTDADLYVNVVGASGEFTDYNTYEFVMPAADVKVEAWIDTSYYDENGMGS